MLDGFIITGGNADGEKQDGWGGGVRIIKAGDTFTLANCTLERNNARSGGGLHATTSNPTLTNCTFYSNSAETGGAMFIPPSSSATIRDCTFTSNFAKESGAVARLGRKTTVSFSNCSFMFNSTDGVGGALFGISQEKDGLRLLCEDCKFTENSARESGGAIFFQGPFTPQLTRCSFARNFSAKGAGAIALINGVTAYTKDCSHVGNRGLKGSENTASDDISIFKDGMAPALPSSPDKAAESKQAKPETTRPAAAQAKPDQPKENKPLPKPKTTRKLADESVFNTEGIKIKLRSIVEQADYTVLALGDLTNPDFISNYREIEAAYHDYKTRGVAFHFVYTHLTHPENNGFIKPFQQRERLQHIKVAKEKLHTTLSWLCDDMDNQTAAALKHKKDNVFIFNASGTEVFAGTISDASGLRTALADLAGTAQTRTSIERVAPPEIPPLNPSASPFAEQVKIDPERDAFLPLKVVPIDSRSPFFVKLRAEVDKALLDTGNGRMYLGFHVDPIFSAEWNNLGDTVNYAIKVPKGTAISPSVDEADKVAGKATDTDPREFILEARKWNAANPLGLTVNYSIHSPISKRNHDVTQKYIIYLEEDPFGGKVHGRQILLPDKQAEQDRWIAGTVNLYQNILRSKDLNRDGKLERDEAPRPLMQDWDNADADSNGYVDVDEYIQWRKSRMRQ
jgi:predicted outer membrane repeat protein